MVDSILETLSMTDDRFTYTKLPQTNYLDPKIWLPVNVDVYLTVNDTSVSIYGASNTHRTGSLSAMESLKH